MRTYSKFSKRMWSLIIVFSMVLSACSSLVTLGVSALGGNEDLKSKTDGEIVAENYDLTEAEKKLLKSKYLIGTTHNYSVPDNSDGLISIDTDTKTITAETYEKTSGYVWIPVSAEIVVGGEVKEVLTITDNKATYTYAENAFSVKVNYEMRLMISSEIQSVLLKAPTALKQGVANLDEMLGDIYTDLATFELGYDTLKELNAAGISVDYKFTTATVSFAGAAYDGAKYTEKAAATALLAQMDANGGKLNLSVLLDGYANAESKVQYLSLNSEKIAEEIANTYEYLYALTGDKGAFLGTLMMLEMLDMTDGADYVRLSTYANAITDLAGDRDEKTNVQTKAGALEKFIPASAWMINDINDDPVVLEGLSAAQYLALDTLVGALGKDLKGTDVSIKNPLLADATSIQLNMSMFDVNVNVALEVVDGKNNTVEYGKLTKKITLRKDATKAEILAAVAQSGIVSDAIESWGDVYVSDKYVVSETDLPATLVEDINYTITYSPKKFNVAYSYAETEQLPYGYKIILPVHNDAKKAYDYTVNGNYYAQGSVYLVTDNVSVSRTEGKAYQSATVNSIVSNNYNFGAGDAKAAAILNSGALLVGNDEVNVRYPDNANNTVTISGNTLKAANYPSSYKDLVWVPYTYTVVDGSNSTEYKFGGKNQVTIAEVTYERIEVVYRLALTTVDASGLVALPAVLAAEAADQLSVLDRLNAKYDEMADINKATFGAANGVIDTIDGISANAKVEMKAAISNIINNCTGSDGKLKIYGMLTSYRDSQNGGLKYYYQNSVAFRNEIETLSNCLGDLLEYPDDLRTVLEAVGYGSYSDKITDLEALISEIKDDLKAPNAAIDTKSEKLGALCAALAMDGAIDVPSAATLVLDSNAIIVNAEGKVTISATVQVAGGAAQTIPAITYNKDYVLTEKDVNDVIAAINSAIAKLDASDKYYETTYNEAALKAELVGKSVDESIALNYIWTAKTFTVKVEGAEDQTVTVDNLTVKLPHGTAAVRYDYIVDGKTVYAGEYTFTLDQLDRLFDNGEYIVTRKEVDVSRETLIDFVNNLNEGVGSNDIVFVLTENNGEYAIVMKMATTDTAAMTGSLKNLAMTLATSYTYVAFDDDAFVYSEDNATKISVQALINTILESGFGSEKLISLIDENGNINNMKLPGTAISDKKVATAGGELAYTTFVLGNSADDVDYAIPMYITLGSAPAYLAQLRNLFATQLGNYFSLECINGTLHIGMTMPQKAYESYLALLIATDNVDITDINAINEDVAIGFVMDVIRPLMESDASPSSVSNTLAKFGYNIDFSGYNDAFEYIRDFCRNSTYNYNTVNSTYDADITVGLSQFIDSLEMGQLGGMIAEKDSGIHLTFATSLINLDKDYDALYFDIGGAGLINKFGLVEDLASKLTTMGGTSVVFVLEEINDDLVFNTPTVLNLNGQTINGNIVGKGGVRIIDSNIDEGKDGVVNGKISGNVKIAGGRYDYNVSAFIPDGYAQDADGVVHNEFIYIVRDDMGNVTVKLNAGILATREVPDVEALMVDALVEMLVHGISANKLYIDDNKIFELTIDDIVGLYSGSNKVENILNETMGMADGKALVRLFNTFVSDSIKFGTIKEVLDKDLANGTETPIFSYKLEKGSWDFSIDYVEQDDSITVSIGSKHSPVSDLNFVISGSDADKQRVSNILGILVETVDVDVNFDKAYGISGKEFELAIGLDAAIRFDFSKDPKYAVMLSVMVADGLGAPANANLVAGLKTYFETDDMSDLTRAFNKLTIAQIVTAVENLQRTDSFSAMVKNLGLDMHDVKDAAAFERRIDPFAKIIAMAVRRIDVTGPATPISKWLDPRTYAYTIDKDFVDRTFSVDLMAGYSFTLSADLGEFLASVKLFKDPGAPKIDYSELNVQIQNAQKLDSADYTPESWAVLQTALDKALDARSSDKQAVVDAAAKALANAIEALELVAPTPEVDYSVLDAHIALAQLLTESKYSKESWAYLKAALNAAIAARSSNDQAIVDAATATLRSAIVALGVDTRLLQAAINKAEALVADDYTKDTWAALQTALAHSIAALNADDQAVIDAATAELEAAIAALKHLPDYTKLNAQIAIAEKLIESDYTPETWATFAAALAAAKAALNSEDQTVVDAAEQALKDAITALKPVTPPAPTVDYTELEKYIEMTKSLNEADYTVESWATFAAALAAAKAALNSDDQAEVDAAVEALKNAIDGLEKKPVTPPAPTVDYTELEKYIEIAKGLDKSKYSVDSWAALEAALAAAIDALNSDVQGVVNAAAQALADAIAALTVDTTALEAAIKAAEKLDSSKYTEASWLTVWDAFINAKAALNSDDQSVIDAATKALNLAIKALVKLPNYDALNEQISIAQGLDGSKYSKTSWAVMQAALELAIAARKYDIQDKVDAATKALADAIAALTVDTTALQATINSAEALDSSKYTTATWEALNIALANAKAALTSNDQSVIDAAIVELEAAIAALKELPNYAGLRAQITIAEGLKASDYTSETWAKLVEALAAAKAALASEDQTVVDAAEQALKDAIGALKPVTPPEPTVDYTELDKQIGIAQGLNESKYSVDSWAALEAALAAAIGARNSNDQNVVDAAAKALADAIAALTVDTTALQVQINMANSLTQSKYSEASWAELVKALAAANAALSSNDQSVINAATVALKTAIDSLTVDTTELKAAIKTAEALDEKKYSVDSWAAMLEKLAKAKATLNSDDQAKINAATKALNDAVAALTVDVSALQVQIDMTKSLTESKYSVASWAAMQEALAAAKAALTSGDQSVIDAATKALKDAIAALTVDTIALQAAIDKADALDSDKYSVDSWKVLDEALVAAKTALTSGDQAVIDAATKALNDALAALTVDTSALQAAINEANTYTDSSKYSAASWATFEKALADAMAALNSNDQSVIDAATRALNNAMKALTVDTSALQALINKINTLDRSKYTTATWISLQNTLTSVKSALNSNDQAVIDEAVKTLQAALDALKYLPDYAPLKAQIAIAEGLNSDDYFADSWARLAVALANAKEALKSEDSAVVIAATNALKAAINALEHKPVEPPVPPVDYNDLNKQIEIAKKLDKTKYSESSWALLEAALAAAIEALNSDDQGIVTAAANALAKAIADLGIDITSLQAVIDVASGLEESKYSEASWKAMQEALAAAKAALASGDQSVINAATKALSDTIAALTVDTTALQAAVDAADALDAKKYSKASWAAMQEALAAAKATLNSDDQAKINAATKALNDAVAALTVDTTALQAIIDAAEALNGSDYTNATWTAMKVELAKAKAALTSNDQSVIDAATTALKNAVAALAKLPDYSALNEQIEIAQGLEESKYSKASWAVMKAALSAAIEARAYEVQDKVDAAAKALKAAIAALTVDTTALQAAIDAAEALSASKYSEASWNAMQEALAAAKTALTSGDQAAINAAVKALNDAVAALTVDNSALQAAIDAADKLVEADYTADTWANFAAALAAAKAALASDDQAAIDAATKALNDAVEALELKSVTPPDPSVDYTELNKQIEIAESILATFDKSLYTEASWKAFEEALAAAKAALASGDQAAIDAATAALKAAVEALELKSDKPVAPVIDYTELNAQIEAAKKLEEKNYTKETWAALMAALEAAEKALTSKDQAEVDKAAADLKAAIEALEEKSSVWPIVAASAAVAVVGGAAAAGAVIFKKRSKIADKTPLVDYNIEDDNK